MPRYKEGEWSGTKQKILMLHMRGKEQKEIAEILGKDTSTINRHINSENFIERKGKIEAAIREKVSKRFADKALWAVDKIVKLAEKGTSKHRLQFDALKEILYQVGCKPVEVVEARTRDYTPQEIESAMLVVKEMEMISDRLGSRKSKFILNTDAANTPLPPAPCQETQESQNIQEETIKANSMEQDFEKSSGKTS